MKRICVITCYKDPDYVRARSLRAALSEMDDVELIVIKNSTSGVLRYVEVAIKTFWQRIAKRPDKYILTFRGYEIFPFIRLITIGKPLYFDEFINLVEWVVFEHKKIRENSIAHKFLNQLYKCYLLSAQKILTDTPQHAEYSSKLMKLNREKFVAIPVGTDEKVFRPTEYSAHGKKPFEVFYYGNMLPLHGIDCVCQAALDLKDEDIHFTLIGGDKRIESEVSGYIKKGAKISYKKRVPFNELPKYVRASDVCLGGPFGDTLQANMVITGKTFQFLASERATIIGAINGKTPFIDRQNSLLVKQGSAYELSEAILWAKNHPKQLEQIAKNGRELFTERFSKRKIGEILRSII